MEQVYAIWLSEALGAGCVVSSKICEYFGSFEEIYNANPKEFANIEGITSGHIEKLADKNLARAEEIIEECIGLNIKLITIYDDKYPENLKNIFNPPILLYVKGTFPDLTNIPVIGIIGSRKPSNYGARMAQKIAEDLSKRGFIVISGMARGIDTYAHKGAINANAPTIAVLGCGVDVLYPPENGKVKDYIEYNGAVISEFAPGTSPMPTHFPVRNRIVSGISNAVLIVEGKIASGSTITVNLAKEQGKDVFCLPGNVDNPLSAASHSFIRDGARLVTSAADIIADMGYMLVEEDKEEQVEAVRQSMARTFGVLTAEHRKIAEVFDNSRPMHIDEICYKSGIDISSVNQCLIMMELSGIVKQLPGKQYILSL